MKIIYESALAPSLRPEGSEARHGHCSVTRLETLESYEHSCTCFKALFISPLDTLGRVVKFLYPIESLQHVWKLQKYNALPVHARTGFCFEIVGHSFFIVFLKGFFV